MQVLGVHLPRKIDVNGTKLICQLKTNERKKTTWPLPGTLEETRGLSQRAINSYAIYGKLPSNKGSKLTKLAQVNQSHRYMDH